MAVLHRTGKFTTLNHPEPDEAGVQKYAVYEILRSSSTSDEGFYLLVADGLTSNGAAAYIEERGSFED